MSLVSWETPWKPATMTMAPSSSAVADPAGRDVDDAGLAVDGVGDDAGLAAGEGAGLVAEVGDRHGQQRHRDPLAGGEQHVQLAAGGQRADLLGEVDQLVGGVAHRRHDHDDVVAGLAGVDDALGDPLDALGVGHGRAAVLLHDQAHGGPPRRTTSDGAATSLRTHAAPRPPLRECRSPAPPPGVDHVSCRGPAPATRASVAAWCRSRDAAYLTWSELRRRGRWRGQGLWTSCDGLGEQAVLDRIVSSSGRPAGRARRPSAAPAAPSDAVEPQLDR